MAERFYVPPIDIASGGQAGQQIGQALSNLPDIWNQGRQQAVRRSLSDLGRPDGSFDYAAGQQRLMGIGDLGGASQLAQMQAATVPKLTDDQREFLQAKKEGFGGSFIDYQTALRRSGASRTSVSVNTAGETEFQKTFGKGQAERYNAMIEAGDSANAMIGDINTLRELGSQIETGKGAEAILKLGPYAESLGIDIAGLAPAQAYQAVISRITPRLRVPGSGASSDLDVRMFEQSLPGLGKTPEGNAVITNTLEGIANNQRAAAVIAREAGEGKITRQEADRRLQSLPDPFTAFRAANAGVNPTDASKPAQAAPIKVQTPEQYQRLKPGDRYEAPDGSVRTKR